MYWVWFKPGWAVWVKFGKVQHMPIWCLADLYLSYPYLPNRTMEERGKNAQEHSPSVVAQSLRDINVYAKSTEAYQTTKKSISCKTKKEENQLRMRYLQGYKRSMRWTCLKFWWISVCCHKLPRHCIGKAVDSTINTIFLFSWAIPIPVSLCYLCILPKWPLLFPNLEAENLCWVVFGETCGQLSMCFLRGDWEWDKHTAAVCPFLVREKDVHPFALPFVLGTSPWSSVIWPPFRLDFQMVLNFLSPIGVVFLWILPLSGGTDLKPKRLQAIESHWVGVDGSQTHQPNCTKQNNATVSSEWN